MSLGQKTWVAFLSAVAVYEVWATVTDRQTLSGGVWAWGVGYPWATSLIVLASLAVLGVHLVYPIWKRRDGR